jgi:NAD(P) transhydrogenase subunit alpha
VVVAREPDPRVALVPADVPALLALGHEVVVEEGLTDLHPDAAYVAAGAVVGTRDGADLVVSVQPVAAGSPTLALRAPATWVLERVPRTGRAQVVDAVTSQALVAGHHGALLAASRWDGLLGRHTTAAGTLGPADALVLGTGVAGLEAIGTLVRLGARVSAHDVRPSCAAEVASLGATYVAADEVADRIAETDLLVTTARSVGQPVPLLVTAAQVAAMRPGAVVVDVAGGNVDGPVAWRGGPDAAAARPTTASRLYSANVAAFVALLTRDPDDEVVRACAS